MNRFPFSSLVSRFVDGDAYTQDIEEKLMIFIPKIEEYLQIELSENQIVCKSLVCHVSRLMERIHTKSIMQGEPSYTEPEVERSLIQHRAFIINVFTAFFPNLELSCIEIYFLALYFCRLEKEVAC